jgi:hypothetical protein
VSNKARSNSKPRTAIPVLVVGDWVIDENWIVAGYDSDSSSHVGISHLRSTIQEQSAQIFSLCAAGNVARALHGLNTQQGTASEFALYGLGLWDRRDTKLIASLFSSNFINGQTPLNLCGPYLPTKRENGTCVTLCGQIGVGKCQYEGPTPEDANKSEDSQVNPSKQCSDFDCNRLYSLADESNPWGTARTIRMFDIAAGKDPSIIYRVDWQFNKPHRLTYSQILKRLKQLKITAKHIVVADHQHGCITAELIRALGEAYKDASWYVRSKELEPPWLAEVPDGKFVLRFIGADCIPDRTETKRWFYGVEVNRAALDELKKHNGRTKYVVALHNDNSMLAIDKDGSQSVNTVAALLADKNDDSGRKLNLGRSSIVFASCVASLIRGETSLQSILGDASVRGQKWSKHYTDALKGYKPEVPAQHLHGDYSKALVDSSDSPTPPSPRVAEFAPVDITGPWDDAFKLQGDIDNEFHIWRGYSCIDGYIAVRARVRGQLDNLYHVVHRFVHKQRITASLNCLVLGKPGFGKSFLARQLAETLGLRPLFFNLSQLTSLEQVIDCFDTIASVQNQNKKRPILVFIDEIDAEIQNQELYSLFLSPILDGNYRRGSHVFRLAPCVWIFAGVHVPAPKEQGIVKSSAQGKDGAKHGMKRPLRDGDTPVGAKKGSDFLSRINGPRIALSIDKPNKAEEEQLRTERVYWGVKLLRETFPDVDKVSKEVLEFFYYLKLDGGPRSLRSVVQNFRNIQYGTVMVKNLPAYSHDLGGVLADWAMRKKVFGDSSPKTDEEREEKYQSWISSPRKEVAVKIVDDPPSEFPKRKSAG